MNKKKIVITGGCGFIGSQVVSLLLDTPHDLYVIDDLSVGKAEAIPLEQVSLCVSDIRSPEASSFIQHVSPDYLIHLAAQTDVQTSVNAQKNDAEVNIVGTIKLIEDCLRLPHFQKFVFASTAAVYGDNAELPLVENSATYPTSPYGQSKKTAEDYLRLAHHLHQLPFVTLRFANAYGHKTVIGNDVISNFFNRSLIGQPSLIYGDGQQTRDFIYILDIAQALISAMDIEKSGTYNVSTNEQTTINEIYLLVQQLVGQKSVVERLATRTGDIRNSRLANGKFVQEAGWQPRYMIQAGLTDMWKKIASGREVNEFC